jgi:hypothetical protein
MKYLLIIIILFLFIFYYNQILSKKEQKYNYLKKKLFELAEKNKTKNKIKKSSIKSVKFDLDNLEANSMIDSLDNQDSDNIFSQDSL